MERSKQPIQRIGCSMNNSWPFNAGEMTLTGNGYVYIGPGMEVIEEDRPEVCPEVWNTQPVDAEKAMAAVRSVCGSAKGQR
jgi:hypothetical protein